MVVLENIYRLSKRFSPEQAVILGTNEVWRSIVAATLTTVTVFLPFLFSEYMIGCGKPYWRLITSTLTVLLFVALLLVPWQRIFLKPKHHTIFSMKSYRDNRIVQIYIHAESEYARTDNQLWG